MHLVPHLMTFLKSKQSGGCGRRFQVSTENKRSKAKQSIKITDKELLPIDTTATDIQLIRNWHLEIVSSIYKQLLTKI